MSNQNQHGGKSINKSALLSVFSRVAHRGRVHSRLGLILIPTTATLGILALVSVFFVSADSASNTYAANLSNQITTEVDGQYYITLTAPDVTFSVSPSNNQNAAKQRVDVGVETNVAGGAKLYLSMAGTSNSLHLNGDTSQTTHVIAATTGANGLDGFADNTWGYSTDDQTYSAVPTTASDPALLATIDGETIGTTSGSVISASIPVYYAAKVDTSIQPGSYSNRVTYSAVTDGGIVTEAELTKITVDGTEVDYIKPEAENTWLITTNLMPNTYGTPRVYYTSTDPEGYQECTNVVTARNESGYLTITCKVTPAQRANGVTIHIVPKGSSEDVFCTDGTYQSNTSNCESGEWQWGNFEISGLIVGYPVEYMQGFTNDICSDMIQGEQLQLIDIRDGKKYWVGKLTDNNCWMTQNLDLDLSNSTTLKSNETDIPSDWTPSASTTTSTSGFSSDTGKSYDPGNKYYENTSGTDQHYHVGNYYQYSAATAGYTGTSGTYSSQQSICPVGWKLPTQSQLQALIDSGLTNSNFMNPPYYLLRGGMLGSSAGSAGYYWSSTGGRNNDYAYYMIVGVSSSGPYMYPFEPSSANSVRCIFAG